MYSPRNAFKEQIYFKAVVKVFFKFLNAASPRRVMSWWKETKGWNKVAPTIRTGESEIYNDDSTLQLTDQLETSESNTGGTSSEWWIWPLNFFYIYIYILKYVLYILLLSF